MRLKINRMNNKIVEITEKLYNQEIDPNEAEHLLLDLFAVNGSVLLSKAKQMQLEQQHKVDSYTEHYTEHELGTLNGIKRIVGLIERHYLN